MLTYADVYGRMLTYAAACEHSGGGVGGGAYGTPEV
jgi:hypothetical protein